MRKFTIFFLLLSVVFTAGAQNLESDLDRAAVLHRSYDFEGALSIYDSLIHSVKDSVLIESLMQKMVLSENGRNMLQFGTEPEVIAARTFSKNDFFLYFKHLRNRSWVTNPNAFVTKGGHPYYSAIYFVDGSEKLIFSAPDRGGAWNLLETSLVGDTVWTAPALINEKLVSTGDEIFPMLGRSGKELYFSSNGLYGMGGYDLYVSRWDEESNDWGEPENLGFPFSSPYDDIMFTNTSDGDYSIFASNRDCSADSMRVYVVAFEHTPAKAPVLSIGEAQRIASLSAPDLNLPAYRGNSHSEEKKTEGDTLYLQYSALLNLLRSCKKDMTDLESELKKMRDSYSTSGSDDQRSSLASAISEAEVNFAVMQDSISTISYRIQEMEMEFLMNGVIINMEDEYKGRPGQRSSGSSAPHYVFERNSFNTNLGEIEIEEPEEEVDYSFKVLEEAVIVEDNTIPDGLVYQIQLFTVSNKVTAKRLNGLSPVFEKKQPSGKYVYCAGLFHSYKEALSNLNTVKKVGFTSSMIVAFYEGKAISIKSARSKENSMKESVKYRVVLSDFPDGIPGNVLDLIRDSCSKEVMKSDTDEGTVYVIAPFDGSAPALDLKNKLVIIGVEGVEVEKIL